MQEASDACTQSLRSTKRVALSNSIDVLSIKTDPKPRHYTATAAQQVQIYCSLVPEPPTLSGVARVVEESQLSNAFVGVQGKSCVMIHFDCQLFGEASKRPNRRGAALTPALLKKLIHGAIKGRGGSANKKVNEEHYDKPLDGDFIFMNDGGRNVMEALMSPFKAKEGKASSVAHHLEYTEITLCLSQDRLCSALAFLASC